MSVQAQESFPVRIAIDQRREQTINRDAKISGTSHLPQIVQSNSNSKSTSIGVVEYTFGTGLRQKSA